MISDEKKETIPSKNLLSLKDQLEQWKKKKNLTPQDIKSIISQINDPVTKLIAEKLLLKL